MLTRTFCCFDGIGLEAEERLRDRGVYTWNDFVHAPTPVFSPAKHQAVLEQINEARVALEARRADWFVARLAPAERLRVAEHFLDAAATLDVETTGLDPRRDRITVIGLQRLADDSRRTFVRGRDFHEFLGALQGLDLVVTFNGERFDVPFLRQAFRVGLHVAHLDLMPVLRGLGYRGGQKAIERRLGLARGPTPVSDGKQAVALWQRYEQAGDDAALDELVRYNLDDVRMLAGILRTLIRRHRMRPLG